MVKVEIKRDGKKAAIDFVPIAELNISEALHRHGVTMQHVAEQLGITRAAVQQMITGSPNVSTIYKIAWVLGCDPRDLFFRMSEDGKIIEVLKSSRNMQNRNDWVPSSRSNRKTQSRFWCVRAAELPFL